MVSSQDIEKIVARIVEVFQPESIFLFGSYASGNANESSDLDLLLVKQTNEAPVNRAADLRKSLRDFLFPMDILVYTPSEIEKDKDRKFTFIHDVLKTGKLLYAGK